MESRQRLQMSSEEAVVVQAQAAQELEAQLVEEVPEEQASHPQEQSQAELEVRRTISPNTRRKPANTELVQPATTSKLPATQQ